MPMRLRAIDAFFISVFVLIVIIEVEHPWPLQAAGPVVRNLSDSGPASLRAALLTANANEVITFAPGLSGTIRLSQQLTSTVPLTIVGPGRDQLVLDGQQTVRILDVTAPLTVTGVTFAYGRAPDDGGAIRTSASLMLSHMRFQANSAPNGMGGAVAAWWTDSVIQASEFISNTALHAGGVFVFSRLDLDENIFIGNVAEGYGGGVFGNYIVAVTNSQFIANHAGLGGGGVWAETGSSFVNVLFDRNNAAQGAALYLYGLPLSPYTIQHVTVVSPTQGIGSAIFVDEGTVHITNTIIANYTVGLHNTNNNVVTCDYTLLAGNSLAISGTVSLGSHNPSGTTNFVDPDNGNYRLGPGSAAIDNGFDLGVSRDLDGYPRPIGPASDIGAYEFAWKLYVPSISR